MELQDGAKIVAYAGFLGAIYSYTGNEGVQLLEKWNEIFKMITWMESLECLIIGNSLCQQNPALRETETVLFMTNDHKQIIAITLQKSYRPAK